MASEVKNSQKQRISDSFENQSKFKKIIIQIDLRNVQFEEKITSQNTQKNQKYCYIASKKIQKLGSCAGLNTFCWTMKLKISGIVELMSTSKLESFSF